MDGARTAQSVKIIQASKQQQGEFLSRRWVRSANSQGGMSMSMMRVKEVSDDMSANRYRDKDSYGRDSYEKNIEKEITNLKEQMNSVTSDSKLSEREKVSEKKKIKEQIQNLDSQLKRYQVQKQQKENVKDSGKSDDGEVSAARDQRMAAGTENAVVQQASSGTNTAQNQSASADDGRMGLDDAEAGVIISISNTKDQINYMHKIKTNLEGRMLTAQTEEEKRALQERINNVSLTMGQKIKKIAEAVEKNQISEEERKEKIEKLRQEEEAERKARRNVVLPDSIQTVSGGKTVSAGSTRGGENFIVKGKVSIS